VDKLQRWLRGEEGASALEFALVLPALLILLIGTVVIGHGLVLRFMLDSAAYDAARTCTLQRKATSGCARAVVNKKLGGFQKLCNSLQVSGAVTQAQGFTAVSSMEVKIDCAYRGLISSAAYLGSNSLLFGTIRVRAVMPY
jgi:Flp pilus assembly protein TadG